MMSSMLPDTLNPATLLSQRFRPDQIPDLTGRVALVTGGSAGIGYWDAAALAQHNATVHIVSANPEHGKDAETEINAALKTSGSKGSVKWHQLDMMHLKKVDAWAKSFVQEVDRLDILIANAGIGQAPFGMTEDGLERHFELWLTHVTSYGRTKLGLIVFASELVRKKLSDLPKPILSISVHPGMVNTEVQKAWGQSYGIVGDVVDRLSRLAGKSAEEGAEASLWAATSTDINQSNWKDHQGKYYSEPYGKPDTETDQAKDRVVASNYWKLCADLTEELLGERLE